MYSNSNSSCCCYTDCCYLNNCCSVPTSYHYSFTCGCCPICRQRSKRVQKLTKTEIVVPSMKSSSITTAISSKNSVKTKKKTLKPKKVGADSFESQDSKTVSNISKAGSHRVHTSLSETFVLRNPTGSQRSSDSSLTNTASYHKFQYSSKQLETINEKQRMNVNLLGHKGRGEESPEASYSNIKSSPYNPQQQDHFRKASENNKGVLNPSTKLQNSSSRTLNSRDKHYYANAPKETMDQPWKCYCFCCNKDSPTNRAPPNLSGHSFSSANSCPQLDVIREEDVEIDDVRRNRTPAEKHAEQAEQAEQAGQADQASGSNATTKAKKQMSLEDSCAEFLNIVCDNILESVQKSVDAKLKEFTNQAAGQIEALTQKLTNNETAIKDLCGEVLEKMTEQNKKNFEVFYSRVQNLVENQNPMKRNVTQDKEHQRQQQQMLAEEENCFIPGALISDANMLQSFSNTKREPTDEYNNNNNNNNNNNGLDDRCGCCHCCLNSDEEERFEHPCWRKGTITKSSIHPCDEVREFGGCVGSANKKQEEIKIPVTPLLPTATDAQNDLSMTEIKLQRSTVNYQELCSSQIPPPPASFTTLSTTASGRNIFNCNCSTHAPEAASRIVKSCGSKIANDKSLDVKLNCSFVHDNYDTSGYATEPEDNNGATVSLSSRKKLQKKASKVPCNSQIGLNILETHNPAVGQDNISESRSSQAIKRLSGSSSKTSTSSSTRLLRL